MSQILDLFLHLDKHLGGMIATYGTWSYLILFAIVFCETGLVITPFLPGDSLLFAAGAFAALGSLELGWVCLLLAIAAIAGDTVNYWIGNAIGPRAFTGKIRFLKKQHLDRTHEFYERHGGKTIILARFIPIIRTFAPFVAGVATMTYPRFLVYNVVGGIVWVAIFVLGGYWFGNLPQVRDHFTLVVLAIILLSVLPLVVEFLRARARTRGGAGAALLVVALPVAAACAGGLWMACAPAGGEPRVTMSGYSPAGAKRQLVIENKLQAIPSAEEARRHHRHFTAEPHPPGSQRNYELALHIAEVWKQQGWEDVRIHRYDVLDSAPREVHVEMVEPVEFRPALREDPYEVDADTKNPAIRGGFLGFSGSADVTAPLIYAHSGNPSDYEHLRRMGISARGKIVLVRYSNPYSYRGFKALTAEREGAAGIIIYSDPAEDGYKKGKVYPDGPWGPESHIQRGAITYDFITPGDPLTPGWASTEGAKRIPLEEAISVPKIPAVPMSWRDARVFLEQMDGPEAPEDWQGGLPLRYRLGGGRVRVHLKVDMDTGIRPIHVVEARLRGARFPDEWVVMGNHRDAWEFGGVDPSSGTATMMEMSRALGELARQGMRPGRTIVLCSWDGEEVALTGSTEWGEYFAQELQEKAVAYVNVDSAVAGPDFRVSAVPSLAPLLTDVSERLAAPSGKSLREEWAEAVGRRRKEKQEPRGAGEDGLVDARIGSGSDHTVFLNHLGIPVADLSFEGPYGVYHSAYDNHFWMNRFGDPGFQYHALMARYWGVLALRLANAEILPLDFAVYANAIRQFVEELERGSRMSSHLKLEGIQRRITEMKKEGERLSAAAYRLLAAGTPEPELARRLNRRLMSVERNWLHPHGIPNRPWFKHILYAARYTYGHLELPALTEAVEGGDWSLAGTQAGILEEALARNAALLREARAELEGAAF